MHEVRTFKNLALIGFMGTGKSSVGRSIAAYMRFRFVDTDELIVQRAGRTIPEIFEQDGEPGFRALEAEIVAGLDELEATVIATGGGLGANPDHLAALKRHSLTICLWASPETIYERVRHASHRPLLRAEDPLARIRELLAEREPVYRQADVLISTELRNVREVTHQVAVHFHQATAATR